MSAVALWGSIEVETTILGGRVRQKDREDANECSRIKNSNKELTTENSYLGISELKTVT